MSTTRHRIPTEQKPDEIHSYPPQVSSFRLTSPVILVTLTLAYLLMFMIWYSPDEIPVLVLNIPLLGRIVEYLIANPNYNLGFIWFTIIAHSLESCYSIRFCLKNNFTPSSTIWYIVLVMYCGGFGMKVLFQYKHHV